MVSGQVNRADRRNTGAAPTCDCRDVRAGEREGPDVMTGANQIETALRAGSACD
jgi:hypothetical protein